MAQSILDSLAPVLTPNAPLGMGSRPPQWQPADEVRFKSWYARAAKQFGLDPDPDASEQKYNYRFAFKAGHWGDKDGHWPSEFKAADHPNRFVDGVDTVTGKPGSILDDLAPVANKAEVKKAAPVETMNPLRPTPGAFVRMVGRQLVSPIEPVKRGTHALANWMEGVDRPSTDANFGDTLKEAAASVKESPASGIGNILLGLSGLPAIGDLITKTGEAVPAFLEHPEEAWSGFKAGAVEGVGKLSPLEAIMMRVSKGSFKSLGKAITRDARALTRKPTGGVSAKAVPGSPVLRKGGQRLASSNTKAVAKNVAQAVEEEIETLNRLNAEGVANPKPGPDPIKQVLEKLFSEEPLGAHPVEAVGLPPSATPPKPGTLSWQPHDPLLGGRESVSPGRAIPEPGTMVGFAEESGEAAQQFLEGRMRRIEAAKTARNREIDSEAVRQTRQAIQAAEKRTRGLKQGAREPKLPLPLPGEESTLSVPRITSPEELADVVAARTAEAQAAPGLPAKLPPIKGARPAGATTTTTVSSAAEVAVKRKNFLQKIKKLETGDGPLDKKLTRFKWLADQQPKDLSTERAVEMAQLERTILENPALPEKVRKQWERLNQTTAARPTKEVSGTVETVTAERPTSLEIPSETAAARVLRPTHDAQGIRLPTSAPKPLEPLPSLKPKAAVAEAAAVETPVTSPRAAEPLTARSEELAAKITPPPQPPEVLAIPPEFTAQVHQQAADSITNGTSFLDEPPMTPATEALVKMLDDFADTSKAEVDPSAPDPRDPRNAQIGVRPPPRAFLQTRGEQRFTFGGRERVPLKQANQIREARAALTRIEAKPKVAPKPQADIPAARSAAEIADITPRVSPLPQAKVATLNELKAAQAAEFSKGAPKGVDPAMWSAIQSIEAAARDVYQKHGILDPRLVNDMRRFWGSKETAQRLGIDKGLVEQLSGSPHRQRPLKEILAEADERYRFLRDDPNGFFNVEALAATAGAMAGGLAGSTIEGEDATDRLAYALSGALIGGSIGFGGARALHGSPSFKTAKAHAEAIDSAHLLAGPAAIKASQGSLGAIAAGLVERHAQGRYADMRRGMHYAVTEMPGVWWKTLVSPTAALSRSGSYTQHVINKAGVNGLPQKILLNVMRPFIAGDTAGSTALRRMGFSQAETDRLMLQGTPTSWQGQSVLDTLQSTFVSRMLAKFPRTRIGALERGVEYTPWLNQKVNTRHQISHKGSVTQERLSPAQLKGRARFGGAMMLAGSAYGYWRDPSFTETGIASSMAGPAAVPAAVAMGVGKAIRNGTDPIMPAIEQILAGVPQFNEADLRPKALAKRVPGLTSILVAAGLMDE